MSANRGYTHTFMHPLVVTLVQIVRQDAGVSDDDGAFYANLAQGTIHEGMISGRHATYETRRTTNNPD